MKNEYRILERQGLFYIQEKVITNYDVFHLIEGYVRMMGVFIVITFPYTFWILYKHRNYKSTSEKWITASMGQSIGRLGKINVLCYPCITLDEATELLQRINTPDKIHYINNQYLADKNTGPDPGIKAICSHDWFIDWHRNELSRETRMSCSKCGESHKVKVND